MASLHKHGSHREKRFSGVAWRWLGRAAMVSTIATCWLPLVTVHH